MVSLVTHHGRESMEAGWGSGARPHWAAAALGAGDALLDFSAARVGVSAVQNLLVNSLAN